ncbi:MAG: metal ABC transporter ATP-binding protein [bacterium]
MNQHSTNTDPPLLVRDMTVAYDKRPVLWDIDDASPTITRGHGSLTAIVGPNGAGKSTFIKACLGLLPVATGNVRFFGQPLAKARALVGYVPQRESVDWDFPVSVLDVVAMGRYRTLGWLSPVTRAAKAQALDALAHVGIDNLAHRQIGQLSGGQQQRVFIARALAQQARLYFMDEPFAGVDAATEQAIIAVLRSLRDQGVTVLVVHHDLQTVPTYFDHALLLNTRLIAAGTIADAFTPTNLQRTYGGRLTLLEQASTALAQNIGPAGVRGQA